VKLHELKPAPGSRKRRIRVGRGIAAGKGKTAGRGTKGQKSRSGGKIPPWFEGGQTPIHVRVPKLRGFKNRGRIEYQVVNVGRIAEYAAEGRFGADAGGKEPVTVNAEVLSNAGLISHAERPIKILGDGDIDVKVFVAADAFTAGARSKIEAAGGFVQLLAPEPEPETIVLEDEEASASDAVSMEGVSAAVDGPATDTEEASASEAADTASGDDAAASGAADEKDSE
jgi:large subunit ribosomal protein L15